MWSFSRKKTFFWSKNGAGTHPCTQLPIQPYYSKHILSGSNNQTCYLVEAAVPLRGRGRGEARGSMLRERREETYDRRVARRGSGCASASRQAATPAQHRSHRLHQHKARPGAHLEPAAGVLPVDPPLALPESLVLPRLHLRSGGVVWWWWWWCVVGRWWWWVVGGVCVCGGGGGGGDGRLSGHGDAACAERTAWQHTPCQT